jgi:hypothetical protein
MTQPSPKILLGWLSLLAGANLLANAADTGDSNLTKQYDFSASGLEMRCQPVKTNFVIARLLKWTRRLRFRFLSCILGGAPLSSIVRQQRIAKTRQKHENNPDRTHYRHRGCDRFVGGGPGE